MKVLANFLISTWYLWVLLLLSFLFRLFQHKIRGFFGEKSVAFFLSRLDQNQYKVIHNLMLSSQGRTSQIDHVVISNYGIFVIETKNYQGWITGTETSDYWTQTIYRKKEKLRNPIKQNFGHIQALKANLTEYPDILYIPIVVFTLRANLKVKTTSHVVYTTHLLRTIRKYKEIVLSDTEIDDIYQKLLSLNVDSKENRKAHVQTIQNELRVKEAKIREKICPKCGGQLVTRTGKYGSFIGCSNYPKCRFVVK